MRSSEVAAIAGVSVRTLRHYHGLGLLDEPPRHANGYRDYSAADLARVLHVKRLAALGFSLGRIKEMLDADAVEGAGAGVRAEAEALDELDRELALQIERLQEQRRTVALLRRESLDPALPVDFGRTTKRLFGGERMRAGTAVVEADRAALMIAGHFYREQDIAELERIASRLEELGLIGKLCEIQQRNDALTADASKEERDALVADGKALAEVVLDCLDPANWDDDADNDTLDMLTSSLMEHTLNPAQREVAERVDQAIIDYVTLKRAQGGS